ncbi:GNAT family N-acetyltransferase [Elizabethkingia anophelis]|uniref:N-acetyltransferase n=4 Tax=Weeksellaceae TaxID=2762318 RepID=X5KAS9_9FLAO|nr:MULTISPECIES: GNAT family N-acetyltransferase [Elizabethkingia]ATC37873.1 N-acetyltransferase [Elizabethkingia anophelis R26]ATC41552.1 N-acetyltransferase [Elizabethkingia anophelis Ag1]QQM27550.1 GNAT family N-acetyltransferase [Elizabethkingia sp. M8]AIL44966.1 acetyltransferase, GNAT family [Elizabethkingia anophelis NUHP1]ATC45230.1 N-acetyltransferase [Elizabethkingia anophelis]
MTNNMVKILEYQTEHFADLTSYTLPEEQAMFSRIPAEVLNNPRIDDETDRFYYTIMYNDKAVGFFLLEFAHDRWYKPQDETAALLRSLTLNPEFQGKGIAKEMMIQLPDLVRKQFPDVKEIAFGVNFKNTSAYQMYLKAGYQDSGKSFDGPKGPQHIMVKEL